MRWFDCAAVCVFCFDSVDVGAGTDAVVLVESLGAVDTVLGCEVALAEREFLV